MDADRCQQQGCALRSGHSGEHCLEPALLEEVIEELREMLSNQIDLSAARYRQLEQLRAEHAALVASVARRGTIIGAEVAP